MQVESEARQAHSHREVTFEEIYRHLEHRLSWSEPDRQAAQDLELQLEREFITVVPAGSRRLRAARREADRVLFLSDMYLPHAFVQALLDQHRLWAPGDELVVSGEIKCSKSTGAMFAHVRARHPKATSWRHCGDNQRSDVRMPRKFGIATEHFVLAHLTRYERTFREPAAPLGPLWRSKAAAALRLARLSEPGNGPHLRAVWDGGASVAGPFLFGFVTWVLSTARSRGIQRLYFVSRDGEILLKIARAIIDAWRWPIEVRYLHGSRQAWRRAAGDGFDDWFREWTLSHHIPSDVVACFTRAGISPEHHEATLSAAGFTRDRWHEDLGAAARERLWDVMQQRAIAADIVGARQASRQLARDYLLQEGFGDDTGVGLVDVGWLGSLQKAVDHILAGHPARERQPLAGFYLGLIGRAGADPLASRMAAYWRDLPGYPPLGKTSAEFFERFTAALHGSVLGYRRDQGRIVPVLETGAHSALLNWGTATLHDSVECVTRELLAALGPDEFEPREFFGLVRANFELLLRQPAREECAAWGTMPVQDQGNESKAGSMISLTSEFQIVRALLSRRRRPRVWWLEGTARLTRSPSLHLALWARSAWQALRHPPDRATTREAGGLHPPGPAQAPSA